MKGWPAWKVLLAVALAINLAQAMVTVMLPLQFFLAVGALAATALALFLLRPRGVA